MKELLHCISSAAAVLTRPYLFFDAAHHSSNKIGMFQTTTTGRVTSTWRYDSESAQKKNETSLNSYWIIEMLSIPHGHSSKRYLSLPTRLLHWNRDKIVVRFKPSDTRLFLGIYRASKNDTHWTEASKENTLLTIERFIFVYLDDKAFQTFGYTQCSL